MRSDILIEFFGFSIFCSLI